jgi:hypothetical protein
MEPETTVVFKLSHEPQSFDYLYLIQAEGVDRYMLEHAYVAIIEWPNGFKVIKDRLNTFKHPKLEG